MSLQLPTQSFPNGPIITTASWCSIGMELRATGSGAVSTAWGTGNKCLYVPFWLSKPFQVVKLLAHNGSAVNGNLDIGVFDADGNAVIGIAAAAQTGTNVWQEFDVTDQWLQPEMYFWGIQNTGTTGTIMMWASLVHSATAGVLEELKADANLPTTATFAKLTAAGAPLVGMSNRTLI